MTFPYKLIDLTYVLDSTIPTWNGDCGFKHDFCTDYSDCEGEDKFRIMEMRSHAGIGTHMDAPSHYNHIFPSISNEAANLLLERGVSALGIDTLSPDRPEDGFKVHQAFLGCGKILIENVANLEKMPSTGGHIMALPIKVKDGTEAPIRLVG